MRKHKQTSKENIKYVHIVNGFFISVCGRQKNGPKDVYIPNARTQQMDLADGTELRIWRWGDCLELSGWPNVFTMSLYVKMRSRRKIERENQ